MLQICRNTAGASVTTPMGRAIFWRRDMRSARRMLNGHEIGVLHGRLAALTRFGHEICILHGRLGGCDLAQGSASGVPLPHLQQIGHFIADVAMNRHFHAFFGHICNRLGISLQMWLAGTPQVGTIRREIPEQVRGERPLGEKSGAVTRQGGITARVTPFPSGCRGSL